MNAETSGCLEPEYYRRSHPSSYTAVAAIEKLSPIEESSATISDAAYDEVQIQVKARDMEDAADNLFNRYFASNLLRPERAAYLPTTVYYGTVLPVFSFPNVKVSSGAEGSEDHNKRQNVRNANCKKLALARPNSS